MDMSWNNAEKRIKKKHPPATPSVAKSLVVDTGVPSYLEEHTRPITLRFFFLYGNIR